VSAEIIIRGELQRQTAIERINALSLDKVWSVTIKPWQKKRSLPQNALFHKWTGIIAQEIGDDAKSVKEELKAMFAPRVEHVSQITKLPTLRPKNTSDMTAAEMAAFMTAVQAWAWQFQAIVLPSPGD